MWDVLVLKTENHSVFDVLMCPSWFGTPYTFCRGKGGTGVFSLLAELSLLDIRSVGSRFRSQPPLQFHSLK